MSSPERRGAARLAPIVLVLLLFAANSAGAHEGEYDPLVLDLHAFLTAAGGLAESEPPPGAVPFPASTPAAPAPPLRFGFTAPVRFVAAGPFEVELTLRADAAVLARDADGNALELTVLPGGTPTRIALDVPLLQPGTVVTVRAPLAAATGAYEEGVEMALAVRALVPLTDGALSLVVGGAMPSRLDARELRVTRPSDLRLQDVQHTEFLLDGEAFVPPATHAVNVFRVGHASVEPPDTPAWSPNGTYVVLRGEETAEAQQHAHADHARRVEAAHELRVNGVLARVHPGLGVVVRVHTLPILVECARNCPADFSWSHAPPAPSTPGTVGGGTPSVLVPPPRDTRGVPVSADEPEERSVPSLAPLAGVVLALAPALALRGRKR